jgi:hypothetical protein
VSFRHNNNTARCFSDILRVVGSFNVNVVKPGANTILTFADELILIGWVFATGHMCTLLTFEKVMRAGIMNNVVITSKEDRTYVIGARSNFARITSLGRFCCS